MAQIRDTRPERAHVAGRAQKLATNLVAAPGIDGVFVGPTDLGIALGLGFSASHEHPTLAAALTRIAAACRAQGRVAGIWCSSAEMGRAMVQLGYRLVVPGLDAMCLKAELMRRLAVLRN